MSSMAFDGEAPETDDEIEEEFVEKTNEKEAGSKAGSSSEKPILIDKNLEKRWTQVAIEMINTCQKRSATQEKTMQKVTESAADCFTSMQNVAAKLNVVHTNVTRLEDSVADLLEASQLFPDTFPTFQFDIPQFL